MVVMIADPTCLGRLLPVARLGLTFSVQVVNH